MGLTSGPWTTARPALRLTAVPLGSLGPGGGGRERYGSVAGPMRDPPARLIVRGSCQELTPAADAPAICPALSQSWEPASG